MTFLNTGARKDGYFLHFETDDKEKYLYMQEQARKCIDNAYTTDFAPVVHAEWIQDGCMYKCSNCGNHESYYDDCYCRVCGAKMD